MDIPKYAVYFGGVDFTHMVLNGSQANGFQTHLFLWDMYVICIFEKISFINVDKGICMFAGSNCSGVW